MCADVPFLLDHGLGIKIDDMSTAPHYPENKIQYPGYECNHLAQSQSLCSSDRGMERLLQGPIDTRTQPIMSQPQL